MQPRNVSQNPLPGPRPNSAPDLLPRQPPRNNLAKPLHPSSTIARRGRVRPRRKATKIIRRGRTRAGKRPNARTTIMRRHRPGRAAGSQGRERRRSSAKSKTGKMQSREMMTTKTMTTRTRTMRKLRRTRMKMTMATRTLPVSSYGLLSGLPTSLDVETRSESRKTTNRPRSSSLAATLQLRG